MTKSHREVADELFGPVTWSTVDQGFCECPGRAFHSHQNGKRDCKIYLNPPSIFCFHTSCAGIIADENLKFRRACAGGKFDRRELTPEEKRQWAIEKARKEREEQLRNFCGEKLQNIEKFFPWNPIDAMAESPIQFDSHYREWREFLKLFPNDGLIWLGDVVHSGSLENKGNFRSKPFWKALPEPPGNFTCPSTFKPNTYSRANENILKRHFLVVESDILTKTQICSVFRWLREFMNLRAIVDTAGKSLHGWYDLPDDKTFEILKNILPELGCDRALFKPAQPVRLPGVKRGDFWQYLVYFNP